ncbi:MAG: carboxypeptidase-like regulatory domain-containing protein [Bacteroidetes bacterium]|nr:MAG: carboxypeptidase-like regulatory domain-containing protein [Bacteroidota bacterium]REK00035.1 MAG: carboxypeptidase-like regulatory domain-containing protein [Bacteroidota bacterium]REK35784.1 MAG: carboxypeptidase-like regulatory domain-containing protein [Bacteroidota bacterium]REK49343.1 MAG: carboxypeptidase-like regulatory domain-containing protein [Bacteroidota bacterium]
MRYFFLIIILSFSLSLIAQEKPESKDRLVQFSGVVIGSDSLVPLPFTSIMIRNTYRGTISDYYGFFSFVAKMNDTIEFAALGYKRALFVIPDTLADHRCSLIQMLVKDTILLKEVVIFPWPTKEQFKEAFLQLRIPDDDLTRAQRNLHRSEMAALSEIMPMDGSMNFKYQMEQQGSRLYYAGQLPPNNLLNPIAWSKFIQMWQNGEFRKKQ